MKTLTVLTLGLFVALSGPALAETKVKSTPVDACLLAGPQAVPSKDCTNLRVAYRGEITLCMERMKAEADARAGKPTAINSHTSRARYLTCDASAREKLAVSTD